jgi:hypothetical protein
MFFKRRDIPAHTCAICGKAMDHKQSGNFHVKNRMTRSEKHAHAECLQREPERARSEGF